MIITDKEAQNLWPELTQDERYKNIAALETMIRNQTNNKFQDIRVRHTGKMNHARHIIRGDFKTSLLQPGDRIEIQRSILNEGLYNIISITDSTIEVDRELIPTTAYTMITKIVYPEDIAKGAYTLAEYDKNMARKRGIKSETIARYSVQYSVDSKTNIDGYPGELLGFIKKYRKLRWS